MASSINLLTCKTPAPLAQLHYMSLNQDSSLFAMSSSGGFRICSTEPYKELANFAFNGGIGIAELYFKSNLIAIVGGGDDPAYSKTKVLFWQMDNKDFVGEIDFKNSIKSVKLSKHKIFVVLDSFVYICKLDGFEKEMKLETSENPRGLLAIATRPGAEKDSENLVFAYPSSKIGSVEVKLSDGITKTIPAHENNIACLALNLDGTRLATASEKGTLIRVFETKTGVKINELRRGASSAEIYCIAFSHNSKYICCTSSSGTLHVFACESEENRKSRFSFFGGPWGYEWSMSSGHFPELEQMPSLCCFGGSNDKNISVFTANGLHMSFEITEEITRKTKNQFFKLNTGEPDKKPN